MAYSLRRWKCIPSGKLARWLGTHTGETTESLEKALEEVSSKGSQSQSYGELLRLCSERRCLEDGKSVHEHLVRNGYNGDPFLGNLLVDMYGKCGDLSSARAAFDCIRERNVYSWTILVTAYSKSFHVRAVLRLVQEMDLEGVRAEKVTYLALVDSVAKLLDVKRARKVHERIVETGWESCHVVGNALVSMYGRCGDVQAAREVFDRLEEKSVVSWNAAMGAYARNGHGREALKLLKLMDLEGVAADRITFLSVVEACTSLGCVSESRLAYARVVSSGLDSDVAVGTSLVNMYGRSGSLADAEAAFECMKERNVVTWNVMMQAYNHSGQPEQAMKLFHEMKDEQLQQPDKVTFINAIEACVGLNNLSDGKDIHERIANTGLLSDPVMGNALMNMYSKCASPSDARAVFESMNTKDVVSWNTLIAAYARNGSGKEGTEVFQEMIQLGIPPDKYTLISALDACCGLETDEKQGRVIHERIRESGYMYDVALVTGLIKMYGKFGQVVEARRLFDGMSRRASLTWSRMITAYGQNGYGREAIELYKQMDVPPDKVTLASVLDACSSVMELDEGRRIHARITEQKLEKDTVVDNTLLDLYGLCGSLEEASSVFRGMQEKDVISWNAIIRAHLYSDGPKEALQRFYEMEEFDVRRDRVSYVSALDACSGITGEDGLVHGRALHRLVVINKVHLDVFVGTALVTMYGRCGSVEDAKLVFDEMRVRNAVTWTSMIRSYSSNGFHRNGLELFFRMEQEGCSADKVTLIAVLETARSLEDVAAGKTIQNRLEYLGYGSDAAVQSALVAMYGKCGCLRIARGLFDGMKERCVVSWNSMISAYARAGEKREALKLFEEMQVWVKPERATYLGILNAVGIAGLTGEEAGRLQESIESNGLERDCLVGTALLNMHTRFGKVAEARKVFEKLSWRDVVSWTSMVMAYASNGSGEEALDLFQEMQLDGMPPDDIIFIGVLFACNHVGRFRQGWEYFVSMRGDYEIEALADHYCCMVDLLGRAGKLAEAEDLISNMPFKPDEATWTALVGSCKLHGDAERADRVSSAMEREQPEVVAPHVLLSNTLAAASSR